MSDVLTRSSFLAQRCQPNSMCLLHCRTYCLEIELLNEFAFFHWLSRKSWSYRVSSMRRCSLSAVDLIEVLLRDDHLEEIFRNGGGIFVEIITSNEVFRFSNSGQNIARSSENAQCKFIDSSDHSSVVYRIDLLHSWFLGNIFFLIE